MSGRTQVGKLGDFPVAFQCIEMKLSSIKCDLFLLGCQRYASSKRMAGLPLFRASSSGKLPTTTALARHRRCLGKELQVVIRHPRAPK